MPDPITFTNEQILAWLDANPHIEARAILSDGRPLDRAEAAFLSLIAKQERPDPKALLPFWVVRNRIMLRWATGTPASGDEPAEEKEAAARRGLAGTVPPVQRRPEGDPAGPTILAAVPLRIEVKR